MAEFRPIYDTTLKHEGGFQKFPNDTANYVNKVLIGTNHGISAIAYATYYKRTPTEADMKALTQAQAFEIFKKNYWNKVNGDKIKNQSVAQIMFQFVIGSGAGQLSDLKDIANAVAGKKVLASTDTTFTDAEAEIINSLDQKKYWEALVAWRYAYYIRIVNASIAAWEKKNGRKITEKEALEHTTKKFLKGWQKRLGSYTYSGADSPTNF